MKQPLLGLTLTELQAAMKNLGMPGFAARQIASWLYGKKVTSVDEMTNLSLKHRELLKDIYEMGGGAPVDVMQSVGGTVKYLYHVGEGHYVEAVYIPEEDKATLCISSQVGCKVNCKFYMTGKQGFTGNLTAGRIINQISPLPEHDKLTNVIMTGMGEPSDNLDEVLKTLEVMTTSYGYGWSPKRVTLSPVGLRKGLQYFAEESGCHLAISLHSPAPQQRRELMPAGKAFSITEIAELLRNYDFNRQCRLSFKYIVFKGVNNSLLYAKELLKLLRGLGYRINLIRSHAIPGVDLEGADMETMTALHDYLTPHGLFTTIRAFHGEDIFAACGMFSTAKQEGNKEELIQIINPNVKFIWLFRSLVKTRIHRYIKRHLFYLGIALVLALFSTCGNGKKGVFTPASSGRAYEILVVVDQGLWERPAGRALYGMLDSDIPGLPQSERSFRIVCTSPFNYDATLRLIRNIIIVGVNKDLYTQPKFKYAKNIYTAPQSILTIQAPDEESFERFVEKNKRVVTDFFTRAEMNRQILVLESEHGDYASTEVKSMFDCDVRVPGELAVGKQGENFFWAGANVATGDQNFVIYSYPYTDKDTFTKKYFVHKRDSVMKIDIPGAGEGMYMETDSLVTDVRPISVQGEYALGARGLWRVKGDYMGGPYVSHVRLDKVNQRIIVSEIFVYSPDRIKCSLVCQIEASLYTLELPGGKQEGNEVSLAITKKDSIKTEK